MNDIGPNVISILGYANNLIWDNDTIALPGSEEAIVYLSQELAKLGYKIKIWANPPQYSKYLSEDNNPQYFFSKDFLKYQHDNEVVICWRVFPGEDEFICKKRIFWPHDIAPSLKIYSKNILAFDSILWLSTWQKENYYQSQGVWSKIPSIILGNGWTPQINYQKFSRNPYSCIYGTNWSRGLEDLLDTWPIVKEKYPDATLSICYGSNTWGVWSPEKEKMVEKRIDQMSKYGIKNLGKLSHQELEHAYQEHNFWVYPNTAKETFCITALKAQGNGCIPITTRKEGLIDSLAPFAESCSKNEEWNELFFNKLENAHQITEKDRQKYIDFTKKWDWKDIAQKLVDNL